MKTLVSQCEHGSRASSIHGPEEPQLQRLVWTSPGEAALPPRHHQRPTLPPAVDAYPNATGHA